MKRIACILVGLLAVASLQAQSAMQWQQVYGGNGVEEGFGVRSCPGQGYIVAGYSSSLGPSDGYVVRTDSLGVVQWEKFYGGVNIDIIRCIKLLPDSGYIMAGYTNSFGNGGYDGWVIRIDSVGDTLWTRTFGTTNWDFFYDVTLLYDGSFAMVGGTFGAGNGMEDGWIVRIDSVGTLLWSRTFGGTDIDELRAVTDTPDSAIIACGYSHSFNDTLGDSWILRIDHDNGDTLWTRYLNYANTMDKALGIARFDVFNGFLVVGESSSTGDPDAYVQMINYDSTLSFNYMFGGVGSVDYFCSTVTRSNGTFAALGFTTNPAGQGNGDLYFFHTRNGWFNTGFGTLEPETGNGIDITQDDAYIICGSSQGFGLGQQQLYLIKTDTIGLTTTVLGIEENNRNVISGTASVFPNPTSSQVNVYLNSYTPIIGDLNMNLFDGLGRIVATIPQSNWVITGQATATASFSVSELPAGIYHYVISDASGQKCNGQIVITN